MNLYTTAYLMGGLGNQMFQISHAICQGWKLNVKTEFRKDSFTPMQANKPENYINNIYRNIKFVDTINDTTIIKENTWNESGLLNSVFFKPIEFHGYFQSSKNFLGFDEKIKKLFSPTLEFKKNITEKYPDLLNKNTISIHVRRGDYLTLPTILPTLDVSYFEESLKRIDNKSTIFIFSDDKSWVKENFNFNNQHIIEGLEDWEELWMMSLCNHNIISNSSFSWWGCFLNEHKNKKVLCPSIWFGKDGPNPFDSIFEKDWTKINVINKNNILSCY